jgi:hypothetical protein
MNARAAIGAPALILALASCGAGTPGAHADAGGDVDAPSLSEASSSGQVDAGARETEGQPNDAADGVVGQLEVGADSGSSLDAPAGSDAEDAPAPTDASWSPQVTGGLQGIWGSNANDVWAVGARGTIVHWDGTAWSTVRAPDPSAFDLQGVWGSAPNDIWAVGLRGILHWDGAGWSPPAGVPAMTLFGVWGSGAKDVWAVGARGVVLRWDGAAWSTIVAGSDSASSLGGVWGSGPKDVWAVGAGAIGHWDGKTWSVGTEGAAGITLTGVWGSGANDVWAVGEGTPEIVHWNGTAWSTIPVESSPDVLAAVWGTGPGDVWVVGRNTRGQGAILGHFDGARWSLSRDMFPHGSAFYGVWGSGANDVWAVGFGPSGVLHF